MVRWCWYVAWLALGGAVSGLSDEAVTTVTKFEAIILSSDRQKLSQLLQDEVAVFQTMDGPEYKFARKANYTVSFNGHHTIYDVFFSEKTLRRLSYKSKSIASILRNHKNKNIIWQEDRNVEYSDNFASATCVSYDDGVHDVVVYFKRNKGKWFISGILVGEGLMLNSK